MINIRKIAISLATPFLIGLLGSTATSLNLPTWYASLHKPSFNPPNWVFAPVWTVLYIMIGMSLYMLWVIPAKTKQHRNALKMFVAQLLLNCMWSLVFFGLRSPKGGLVVIVLLLLALAITIKRAYAIYKPAALLLVPYFLWTSFATILNVAIVILN